MTDGTGLSGTAFFGKSSCIICNKPLTVHQEVSGGVCGRSYCRQQNIIEKGRIAREKAEREQRRRAQAHFERLRAAMKRSWPDDTVVAVVPANTASIAPLPDLRKEAIETHIRKHLAKAQEQLSNPPENVTETENPYSAFVVRDQDLDMLGAACGACRGHCCRTGGEHAYITADTMKHYLERHAHAETDRVVQDYLDYLPTDSYEDGCVFQGRKGCTLPRDMRSITCNTFLCPSLRNIQDHLEKDAVRTVFAVAMTEEIVKFAGLIDDGELEDFGPPD